MTRVQHGDRLGTSLFLGSALRHHVTKGDTNAFPRLTALCMVRAQSARKPGNVLPPLSGAAGFEPRPPGRRRSRSNQLSYRRRFGPSLGKRQGRKDRSGWMVEWKNKTHQWPKMRAQHTRCNNVTRGRQEPPLVQEKTTAGSSIYSLLLLLSSFLCEFLLSLSALSFLAKNN